LINGINERLGPKHGEIRTYNLQRADELLKVTLRVGNDLETPSALAVYRKTKADTGRAGQAKMGKLKKST